jgi:ketosteroid isomerase-like protein
MAMNEKDILALEEERFAAMIARDFPRLQLLVHDELMYTHSSGVVDGKATWLDSMKSGRVKYKKAQCTERKVRMYGETALITGRAQIEAEIGGQPKTLKLLFLNAWTKTPQGWKFVAWQSTPMPA